MDKVAKVFLRMAIALAFLSAIADRLGLWPKEVSVWGSWGSFVEYTAFINPWFSSSMFQPIAITVTAAEVIFALCLILGFRTELFAKLSGILLLVFALAMTFSGGFKAALDYSVFTASAAAFALALMKEKYLELDTILSRRRN